MEKYKSIKDAAIELGVSSATIRNWIKNGSLQCLSDDKNYVLDASINKLKQEIENGQNSRLKARRNKSKIKGNHLSTRTIQLEKPTTTQHLKIKLTRSLANVPVALMEVRCY